VAEERDRPCPLLITGREATGDGDERTWHAMTPAIAGALLVPGGCCGSFRVCAAPRR
jgi:hypothetical protein